MVVMVLVRMPIRMPIRMPMPVLVPVRGHVFSCSSQVVVYMVRWKNWGCRVTDVQDMDRGVF